MRISRREFVKSVTASGIALTVSPLAIAAEPSFTERETLPGRQGWNPAATGMGRIDGIPKVTGAKLYASDFRAADLPGWPQNTSHAMLVLAPDATHVYTGLDLERLRGALKPTIVVTAADLARVGTRVPEFYAGDLFCPVGTTPLYLGQPVALLIFEQFDAFDQARLALRDGTFVKFGEETGPIRAPDYGAYRFTRVAGPTPDAPDVYSTFKDGLAKPEHFQDTELPVWAPFAMSKAPLYAKAAAYGEQIRAELAASNPALLVLDREFETASNDPMFLEPECGIAWYDAGRKNLGLVLGVQSPFENAEAIVYLLGETRADFKPARINAQFAYIGGGFGGRDHTPFPLYVALAGMFFPDRPVRLAYNRYQQFQAGIKRHAFKLHTRIGVDRASGKLVAFAADHILDGGGLANFSGTVALVGAQMAIGVYEIPRVDVTTVALHSRGVTAGSMRATECWRQTRHWRQWSTNYVRRCRSTRSISGDATRSRPAAEPCREISMTSRSARRRSSTSWRSIRSGSSVPMKRPGPKRGHSWGQASLVPARITAPGGTRRSRRWKTTRMAGLPSIAMATRWATPSGRQSPIGSLPIWVAWPTKSRSRRWTGSARSRS